MIYYYNIYYNKLIYGYFEIILITFFFKILFNIFLTSKKITLILLFLSQKNYFDFTLTIVSIGPGFLTSSQTLLL